MAILAILAVLPGLPGADDPLGDQIALLATIHCAELESRTEYRIPGEPQRAEIVRFLVKGGRFALSRLDVAPDGRPHLAQAFAFNGTLWQYIDASGAMQIVPARARTDAHLLPWCPGGMESPPVLQLFSFLHYVDHVPDQRMRFSLDALQDRTWVERRLATSVERIVPGADGSTTLMVLYQKAPPPPQQPQPQRIDDEMRFVIRPHPEFMGLRLLTDIDVGTTGAPASSHLVVTYRSIAFADGTGSLPFPVAIATPGADHPAIRTDYTTIILNGMIDDGAFDLDPTRATSILDPFTGGLIKQGE